ncbi:beta-phosphoglucomutase [Orenia metallireducens]|uniref:Beta-phosphoglucomutase n=1 Tax=Orenia metallireducens TaxID=1413210 RepID=A0A285HHU5_9FIRM|nr:beta-phosphoglucomutase [Orenia metallireducens]PRX27203.1 beta-phosphoglucomutase [Orenia metallireducens]SNY35330.1 beta-phosphoglucomutase [Orenia metallireducens]
MSIEAVIFDLDGVIVSTDEKHYQAWKKIADEEGISFDREFNERFRGVSRMDCLEMLIAETDKEYSAEEKKELATRKNNYYRDLLQSLDENDILSNVINILEGLKEKGIKIAVGSSSRNTPLILKQIGLDNYFDGVADGNQITKSKPDPEVFLLAAEKVGVDPEKCLVVEDADAGIEAAIAGGMKTVGVASASSNLKADLKLKDLSVVNIEDLLDV